MYCALLLLVSVIAGIELASATPLDDYVNKPDPTYSWKVLRTNSTPKSTVYVLNLTSQTWMDCKIFDDEITFSFHITTYV